MTPTEVQGALARGCGLDADDPRAPEVIPDGGNLYATAYPACIAGAEAPDSTGPPGVVCECGAEWSADDLADAPAEGSGALIRCLADVKPEAVEWLWPGRIPAGKLTFLEGDSGTGKSALALDLLARITSGRPLPGVEAPAAIASALVLTVEDGLADAIRPRLDAAGAESCRVFAFEGVIEDGAKSPPRFPRNCFALQDENERVGARIVMVDPLSAFISADLLEERDSGQALAPLA